MISKEPFSTWSIDGLAGEYKRLPDLVTRKICRIPYLPEDSVWRGRGISSSAAKDMGREMQELMSWDDLLKRLPRRIFLHLS